MHDDALDQTKTDPQQGPQSEADQISGEAIVAALTETVTRRIRAAMQARQSSGIEQIWAEDQDQYDGIDDVNRPGKTDDSNSPASHQKSARSKVYLNITKPKTIIGIARVQEMLVPTDQKPWDTQPTPIPELLEAAEGGGDQVLTLKDGTQMPAETVARAAMAKAQIASDKMGDWIEDQFVEGSVYAELRKVIRDAGRLGTGVLKGPFPVSREQRKWRITDGTALLEMSDKISATSKKIDPRDFFPDPACGENIHNGSYVVERDYTTARQLRRLAKLPDYDGKAIADALREGPQSRARDYTRQQDKPGDTFSDSDVFELFYYYGDLDPDTLIQMGVSSEELTEEALYLASVPAIVTMLNDRPIKAVINPLESGEFPYDVFPWEPVDGQWTGRGIPRAMGVPQRILVAGSRALMENAGLSAGPQIGITKGALKPVDGNYGITGRKLWEFTPNEAVSDINKAMAVWTIPSAQAELQAIIDFALKMADDLTNLPMLMQGQQGAAPELLGGMQLLMQNANAPLRVIAKQFDDYLIAPHLKRYYEWGMQNAPDDCKGDIRTRALGSTALAQMEVERDFLIQAHSLAQRPGSRISMDKLEAKIMRANGVSMDEISYTDPEWEALQKQQQEQPPPQDPRIEAANIRAQSVQQQIEASAAESQQRMQIEREEAALDRAHEGALKKVEFQIQALEFSGRRDISLEQMRTLLTTATIKSRDGRQLFAAERALKLDPNNPTQQGI